MRRTIFIFLLLAVCFGARAQRTMPGQFFANLSVKTTFTPSLGGEFRFGRNTNLGLWDVDVDFSDRVYASSNTSSRVNISAATIGGEYLYRAWHSRSRAFNFYAGGGAFFGVEFTDLYRRLKGGEWPVDKNGKYISNPVIIFGLRPRVQFDWYLAGGFALTADATAWLNILTKYSLFTFDLALGVKYDF